MGPLDKYFNPIYIDFVDSYLGYAREKTKMTEVDDVFFDYYSQVFWLWLFSRLDFDNKDISITPIDMINDLAKKENIVGHMYPESYLYYDDQDQIHGTIKLIDLTVDKHPIIYDTHNLLCMAVKGIRITKKGNIYKNDLYNLLCDSFHRSEHYINYLFGLLSQNGFFEFNKDKNATVATLSSKGDKFLDESAQDRFKILFETAIEKSSSELIEKMNKNLKLISIMILNELDGEKIRETVELYFSESNLIDYFGKSYPNLDLNSLFNNLLNDLDINREKVIQEFNEFFEKKSIKTMDKFLEEYNKSDSLFICQLMMDIESIFRESFIHPFSNYFMLIYPYFDDPINFDSVIELIILENGSKKDTEQLIRSNYSAQSIYISGFGQEFFDLDEKIKAKILPFSKIGRNELCPCGSGKKYKKCCGR